MGNVFRYERFPTLGEVLNKLHDENAWIKQGRTSEAVDIKIIDINALLQAIEDSKND